MFFKNSYKNFVKRFEVTFNKQNQNNCNLYRKNNTSSLEDKKINYKIKIKVHYKTIIFVLCYFYIKLILWYFPYKYYFSNPKHFHTG